MLKVWLNKIKEYDGGKSRRHRHYTKDELDFFRHTQKMGIWCVFIILIASMAMMGLAVFLVLNDK